MFTFNFIVTATTTTTTTTTSTTTTRKSRKTLTPRYPKYKRKLHREKVDVQILAKQIESNSGKKKSDEPKYSYKDVPR